MENARVNALNLINGVIEEMNKEAGTCSEEYWQRQIDTLRGMRKMMRAIFSDNDYRFIYDFFQNREGIEFGYFDDNGFWVHLFGNYIMKEN